MTGEKAVLICLVGTVLSPLPASASDDIDRPGIGYWCYSPVRSLSVADKKAFVDDVSAAAIAAERKWRVPAPVLAAMAIIESGFGTTRLAIKSNNVLAFKWPGEKIAQGRQKFILWCQPPEDKGNIYPMFSARSEAIDFVASRLSLSEYYKEATKVYAKDIGRGIDRKSASRKWLATIAPIYNWKPAEYVPNVDRLIGDPIGDRSRTLWSLEP
jgi:hypothetical protein